MAFANPHITAVAVEATEFPDLARKYQVSGVPKTVVAGNNVELEILGALPQDAYIEQALSVLSAQSASSTTSSEPEHEAKR